LLLPRLGGVSMASAPSSGGTMCHLLDTFFADGGKPLIDRNLAS
jgi:hypothetical protein